jgi:hypothetical protein
VITGPFDSVRGMYKGDLVKTAPKPGANAYQVTGLVTSNQRSHAQLFESVIAGAVVDLGQQAQDRC